MSSETSKTQNSTTSSGSSIFGSGCGSLIRTLYLQCKEAVKSQCGHFSNRLVIVVDTEFHAVFTFVVVLMFQLLYLRWIISDGAIAERNFLSRYFTYINLAIFLIISAILRCMVGYVVNGDHVQSGDTYDYPTKGGGGRERSNANQSSQQKTSKEKHDDEEIQTTVKSDSTKKTAIDDREND